MKEKNYFAYILDKRIFFGKNNCILGIIILGIYYFMFFWNIQIWTLVITMTDKVSL